MRIREVFTVPLPLGKVFSVLQSFIESRDTTYILAPKYVIMWSEGMITERDPLSENILVVAELEELSSDLTKVCIEITWDFTIFEERAKRDLQLGVFTASYLAEVLREKRLWLLNSTSSLYSELLKIRLLNYLNTVKNFVYSQVQREQLCRTQ
ncbi:MAG: hypothetical protein DRJ40_01885 [Thermoprotei archaeon]|nr:MAG: hypothetical protein DRJ40_01885 [Thermoprotei archaeon]